MRKSSIAGLTVALTSMACLALATGAAADGLPVFGTSGGQGILSLDGGTRFVAIGDRAARRTLVEQIQAHGGEVERSTHLDGTWTIAPVAFDSSTTGLSADGSTLALVRPGFGLRDANIAILDAPRLKLLDRVHLDGTFSLDAISPDGDGLFLIHYANRYASTNYRVQRYDVSAGTLGPAIVDPQEPDENMGGYPYSRALSPDGRWAYTLYDGPDEQFIHALDTQRGEAVCIDLDKAVPQKELWRTSLKMSPDGGTVSLIERGTVIATLNTGSFEVTDVEDSAGTVPPTTRDGDTRPAWWLLAGGAAALILALGLSIGGFRARRRRSTPPEPDWDSLETGADDEASRLLHAPPD
jgi:hypothetical protein